MASIKETKIFMTGHSNKETGEEKIFFHVVTSFEDGTKTKNKFEGKLIQ